MAMCKRCGRETEPNEIHLFRGGEERRQAIEEGLKTKVTLCTNPPPPEFWEDIRAEEFEEYLKDNIKPVAYIKSVVENTDFWSVTIEIPKPIGGLPISGEVYSLEIIQDKQSILDRIDKRYSY